MTTSALRSLMFAHHALVTALRRSEAVELVHGAAHLAVVDVVLVMIGLAAVPVDVVALDQHVLGQLFATTRADEEAVAVVMWTMHPRTKQTWLARWTKMPAASPRACLCRS